MAQNEFFILITTDFTHAFDEANLTTATFTPDVVSGVSTISAITVTSGVLTITTTAVHGLRVGMGVYLADIVGVNNATGPRLVTNVGSTTQFQVTGDFSGSYVSGGTVHPNENARGSDYSSGGAFMEKDMLAINEGVVVNPGGGSTGMECVIY